MKYFSILLFLIGFMTVGQAQQNRCFEVNSSYNEYYYDGDGDGFGLKNNYICAASLPSSGYALVYGDCDDTNPNYHAVKTYYRDIDGDGYGSAASGTQSVCVPSAGYVTSSNDCNDNDASINPGASELCGDGIDNNCNNLIDNTTPPNQPSLGSMVNQCGETVLNRPKLPGEIPAGETWYWQATATGEDISTAAQAPSKTFLVGGTYYLRARKNSSLCWSTALEIPFTVKQIPANVVVTTPSVTRCGPGQVTLSATANTNQIRWYSNGAIVGTGTNFTVTVNESGTYYAENYNTVTECKSTTKTPIVVTITPTTTYYLDSDNDGHASTTLLSCNNPGTGYTTITLPLDDCNDSAYSPSNDCANNQNYVYTRSYQNEVSTIPNAKFKTDATADNYVQNISYFDGLGRPMQQNAIRQSPNEKDIITHVGYDGYGRQEKEWLPYEETDGNHPIGEFHPGDVKGIIRGYYKNHNQYGGDFPNLVEGETNPYSEKFFEPSPLNRVLKQAAPGEAWKLNPTGEDHTIEFDYNINSANEVRLFTVTTTPTGNTYTSSLGVDGFYTAGELYKNITKDENHDGSATKLHTTEEFTDKQGRVVLKRTYADVTNGDGSVSEAEPHDTYYVYDDFGNLTYVLPPKMEAGDGNTSLATLNTNMAELGYRYVYDQRNRLIEKQIPGKEKKYIVYNQLDQPIMTQDANQREKSPKEWLFTKYDVFGRVAFTGKATDDRDRDAIQTDVDALTDLWVDQSNSNATFGDATLYYNDGAYPSNANSTTTVLTEVLTINYYDKYVDIPTGAPSGVTLLGSTDTNTTNVKGLATGSRVKVLEVTTPDVWINTITYYDDKARPIYTYSKNGYLGTTDIMETELDFVGKPIKSKSTHTKGGVTITTLDNFTYDHTGRLLAQTQCIGDGTLGDNCPAATGGSPAQDNLPLSGTISTDQVARISITMTSGTIVPTATLRIDPNAVIGANSGEELIVFNEYDALGQLKNKKVGGSPNTANVANSTGLQTVTYGYNVRGWLTGINDISDTTPDKLFNFSLSYNQGSNALYNGNIAKTQWRTNNQDKNLRSYDYTYDALNRITAATGGTGNANYDVTGIIYDKNGNIGVLNRRGNDAVSPISTNYDVIDNLDYQYGPGNKLLSVTDTQTGVFGDQGFKDGNKTGNDFVYDANGNMTSDANKGITAITYNHLNLPTLVAVSGSNNGTISYVYDATGTKLRKNVVEGAGGILMDYAGNYIYESGKLQFFSTSEGYVQPKNPDNLGQGYEYVYNFTDHLGNVRLSYTDANGDGDIDVTNDPLTTEIVKENNYYPFGLKHKGYNGGVSPLGNGVAKKFMYNGIEHEEALGMNLYEMDVRSYDPAIARFTGIDPITHHSQSTYNAFDNNPIYWADPSGADAQNLINDVWDSSGDDTTWTNNGDGTFSGSNGRSVDCDECPKEGQQRTRAIPLRSEMGQDSHKINEFYHAGGVFGSEAGWYTDQAYAKIIRPVAENLSRYMGGWDNSSMEIQGSYDAYVSFMASRSTADGFYDFLLSYGNGLKHGNNSRAAFQRSGLAEPMHFSSPIFLGAGLLRNLGTAIGNIGSTSIPVYRVFGGGARAQGYSWSLINPRLYGNSYRNFSGLPNVNSANFMIRGNVQMRNIIKLRPARPISAEGSFGRLVPEAIINPNNVSINAFRVLN